MLNGFEKKETTAECRMNAFWFYRFECAYLDSSMFNQKTQVRGPNLGVLSDPLAIKQAKNNGIIGKSFE